MPRLRHNFLKYKILVMKGQFTDRSVRVAMGFIEKLHNLKTAFVNIKVDVPLFKIRCNQTPDFCFCLFLK